MRSSKNSLNTSQGVKCALRKRIINGTLTILMKLDRVCMVTHMFPNGYLMSGKV